MYDCSKEFNKFYRTSVVLPETEQNELREKRKLNVKRLKEGLLEYNEENKKDYKISEDRIQGSMAMHTNVQNDEGDYDIDVGIVFESSNLNGLGPLASRNMVADALKRKTKQFAEEPEVKTSCVRLKYTSTGYHVDFALFKRDKDTVDDKEYTYEHAGAEWSICDWIYDEMDCGNKIYPKEPFVDISMVVSRIKTTKRFSKQAFEKLMDSWGKSEGECKVQLEKLNEYGYCIEEKTIEWCDSSEKKNIEKAIKSQMEQIENNYPKMAYFKPIFAI